VEQLAWLVTAELATTRHLPAALAADLTQLPQRLVGLAATLLSTAVLVNLPAALWARLARLAGATRRCPSGLVPTAVRAVAEVVAALAQRLTEALAALVVATVALAAVVVQVTRLAGLSAAQAALVPQV
jgi:predicted transcriptional regulator